VSSVSLKSKLLVPTVWCQILRKTSSAFSFELRVLLEVVRPDEKCGEQSLYGIRLYAMPLFGPLRR
jgi:hypothetical protein